MVYVSQIVKCYQLFQPEKEFDVMEECMWHCASTYLQKGRHFKSEVGMGGKIIGPILHHSF